MHASDACHHSVHRLDLGSALNLNLHFHVLFVDGLFSPRGSGQLRFHRLNAPTNKELNALVATIGEFVARYQYRDRATPVCCGEIKKFTAEVEADELPKFPEIAGSREIFKLSIDFVQTSCGTVFR